MKPILGILLGVAVMLGPAAPALLAAEFVPPAEGPVAFRRDKVPLDEEAITGLSSQLEILARGLPAESAAERRAAAQMLALSLALDPANGKARELVAEYKEGRHEPRSNGDMLEKTRVRIWQLIEWLETSDAGNQGRALADCLKDVIIVSDPKHPKADTLRGAGEKGAWTGWVATVSSFEDHKPIAHNDAPSGDKPKDNGDKPSNPRSTPSRPTLDYAQVQTVLWKNEGNNDSPKWVLAPASLSMSIKKTEDSPFAISIGAGENWEMFSRTNWILRNLLAKQYSPLPNGMQVIITSKDLEQSILSSKRQSVSAAAGVLAGAAVTGVEPAAIIIGQIDGSGAYKLSSGFWSQIEALEKGKGGRLILPAEAATLMPSMLAMENPSFFMKYEVLLASDFKQLLALAAKKPDASLATTLQKFGEIRDKSVNQEIRQYIANPFVRQRLAEVSQDVPYHLSAKMLLLQAEGKRPTLIVRRVLASKLRQAVEPMAWISENPDDDLSDSALTKLGSTDDACRSLIDGFERYTDKNDRALIDQTRDVVATVHSLERAARTRAEYYIMRNAIRASREELIRQAKELNEMLSREVGDAPTAP
ncbi:MAG: hypothetical protein WCS43_04640 [Verrucomicrobiota bacterium]